VHEELWQPLVADALVRTLGLLPEHLHREVRTEDGSRADLVYVHQRRILSFELKMADPGQASVALDTRAVRQLRHFRDASDQVYLVTIGAPRAWNLVHDGAVVAVDPLEAQVLPEGVGWIAFDRLSLEVVVLKPAPELQPKASARRWLVNDLLGRVGRMQRMLQGCLA